MTHEGAPAAGSRDGADRPRVSRVATWTEVLHHAQEGLPCIWSGPDASRFPFHERWTKAHLAATLGEVMVGAHSSPTRNYVDPGDPFRVHWRSLITEVVSFGDLLERGLRRGMVLSGTEAYLYHRGRHPAPWGTLWPDCAGLMSDTGADALFSKEELFTAGFWVSGAGVASMAHFDTSSDHNLNFQVRGRKRVTLFPPRDWVHLNTFLAMSMHPFETLRRASEAPTRSDGEPSEWADAAPVVAELEEGEALLIPSRWFHFVQHRGSFNVNLTCWFIPSTQRKADLVRRSPVGQSCRAPLLVLRLALAMLLAAFTSFLAARLGLRLYRPVAQDPTERA